MSYCMFQNTKQDLNDCVEKVESEWVEDLSEEEYEAMKKMYGLCKRFVALVETREVEWIEDEDWY